MTADWSNRPSLVLLLLRCACRFMDSPATIVVVWVLAALSSAAVLAQHQRLAEDSLRSDLQSAGPIMLPSRPQLRATGGVPQDGPAHLNRLGTIFAQLVNEETAVQKRAVTVMLRIAENLVKYPKDPKYMLIWKENKVFLEGLGQLSFRDEAMKALGFRESRNAKAWEFQWGEDSPSLLEDATSELREELKNLT
mmetsp:Transcript_45768/g.85441  ORF Transcript_45768/g.85441 Transcript_45768/m.85441 type:complete len:194 (-) Transcript_45768:34-615(-)